MSTKQIPSKTTRKEKKISSKILSSSVADRSRPDRTELLIHSLDSHGIWDLKKREFKTDEAKEVFNELLFSIYVAWLVKNFHLPYQGNICFVGLDKKSVILIPPTKTLTAYINSHSSGLEIYKETIFSDLLQNNLGNCPICITKNLVNLNLKQMVGSNSKLLRKIDVFPQTHKDCGKASLDNIQSNLTSKIVKDPRLSAILGGFGFVIGCPSNVLGDICKKYFSEIDSPESFSDILDDLFMACLMLLVMNESGMGKIATNSLLSITGCDNTTELDGLAYSNKNCNLVIAELTSLYDQAFHSSQVDPTKQQFPMHFQGKVETFNRLENNLLKQKNQYNLKYFYIHLKEMSADMRSSLHFAAVKNNNKFINISLEEDFESLKSIVDGDNFTNGKLYGQFRKSYGKFIKHFQARKQ